jgi:hypothetical protein
MEFKGTKGKWFWNYGDGCDLASLVSENGNEICNFGNEEKYYPTAGEEPNQYDALLISKAPEMIEFLQELSKAPKDLNPVYWIQKAKQLIKEATEI